MAYFKEESYFVPTASELVEKLSDEKFVALVWKELERRGLQFQVCKKG